MHKFHMLKRYFEQKLNPGWPHRQGGCLLCLRLQCRLPAHMHAPIYIVHDVLRGYCPLASGLTATKFDVPSLTPLSVAGCGRLQQGVASWATSVALLQVVDI